MLVLRDLPSTNQVSDPYIRSLVQQRIAELSEVEPWDAEQHGYFIVVEPGDTVAQLEAEVGWPILDDPFYESLEEHDGAEGAGCFEMLFITNDDGFGITVIIPKTEGVAGDLLALCKSHSTPAVTS